MTHIAIIFKIFWSKFKIKIMIQDSFVSYRLKTVNPTPNWGVGQKTPVPSF